MSKKLICTQCGTIGKADYQARGSGGVEILLYLFFFFPGIIYSVWRRSTSYAVCPTCGGTTMIPIDSPRAFKILAEQSDTESAKKLLQEEKEAEEAEKKRQAKKERRLKIAVVATALFVFSVIMVTIAFGS